MILNLTFFPCNGTVSIHYLVLLSENVVANVTTSENYSGMLNDAATNILHLFLTQFDSGVVFGVSWMEVATAFYSTMFIVTHRQILQEVRCLVPGQYFKTHVFYLNVVSKIIRTIDSLQLFSCNF